MRGIVLVLLVVTGGVLVFSLIRGVQRGLGKLHALIVKGEQHHDALVKKAETVRHYLPR